MISARAMCRTTHIATLLSVLGAVVLGSLVGCADDGVRAAVADDTSLFQHLEVP